MPENNLAQLLGAVTGRKNDNAANALLGQLEKGSDTELLNDPNFQRLRSREPERANQFVADRSAIRQSLKVKDEESEKAFFQDMRNVKIRLENEDLTGAMSVLLKRRAALLQIPGAETDDVDRILNRLESGDFQGALGDLAAADQIAVSRSILDPISRADEFKDREIAVTEDGLARDIANDQTSLALDTAELAQGVAESDADLAIRDRLATVQEGELELSKKEDKSPKLTAPMRQAAGFSKRMQDSSAIIADLGGDFAGTFALGGLLPQGAKSDNRQQFEQATRNFINATLRRESGAAIAPSEFESADIQYIPQRGDSEAVLEQKAKNRQTVSNSLMLEAGAAFDELQALDNTFEPSPAGPGDVEGEQAIGAGGVVIIVRDGMWVLK